MVKNLPYFHVWFGLEKSFGHVIENEAEGFEPTFGREILAGMMELSRNAARRPPLLSIDEEKKLARELQQRIAPFDWTQMLQ